MEERYEECEVCEARYTGEEAISRYLRHIDTEDERFTVCKGHNAEVRDGVLVIYRDEVPS